MDRQEALEIFDGTILGDGSLNLYGKNAYFRLNLSKGEPAGLLSYLSHIKAALLTCGFPVKDKYPKLYSCVSRGKPYTCFHLETRTSLLLTKEYFRWYRDNIKIVPSDVRLTPLSVAHWFMGDGSSSKDERFRVVAIDAALNTQGFSVADVLMLEEKLLSLNLFTGRRIKKGVVKGAGIGITIHQDSVNKFMNIIGPYMMEPYMFKLKYRGSCSSSLEKY